MSALAQDIAASTDELADRSVVKLQWEMYRGIVTCTVFVGADRDTLKLAGELDLAPGEALAFRQTIRQGIGRPGFTGVLESGWPVVLEVAS